MDDVFTIKIKVHDESELYNRFDGERLTPNDEVVSYIAGKIPNRRYKQKTDLEIISDNAVDRAQFKKALDALVDTEEAANRLELRKTRLKQVFLVIVGIAFIALSFYLTRFEIKMIAEISSIIGSFSIWEATNIWLIESKRLYATRRRLEKMKDTQIK